MRMAILSVMDPSMQIGIPSAMESSTWRDSCYWKHCTRCPLCGPPSYPTLSCSTCGCFRCTCEILDGQGVCGRCYDAAHDNGPSSAVVTCDATALTRVPTSSSSSAVSSASRPVSSR